MLIRNLLRSNRTRRSSPGRLGARGLLLLLLASCSGDGTGIGQPTRITIEPGEPVSLYTGDTLTVRATIRNTPHTGVSYSSSAPEIVQVDATTGLATALAPGSATITGVSLIDPRIYAEAQLTVLADLPASLALDPIRSADGVELDPAQVTGRIEVRVDVSPGNARRLEVLLGDTVACEKTFVPPLGEPPPSETFACAIDTRAFDEATAEPLYMNGETVLRARLIASGERTLARSPDRPLALANPARIVTSVEGERNAVDAAGLGWISGDVTIEAIPVVYEPAEEVETVGLTYGTPAGADTTASDSERPFIFTLPAQGILGGVTDPDFRVTLSSSRAEGEAGPAGASEPARYDGSPPRPGTLIPRDWIGAQTRFVDTYSPEGEMDAGVGRIHLRFFAGDPALSAEAIVAGGTPVVVGADLPQAAGGSYRLVAEACDGLENCALRDGYEFGVDVTPPVVESVSIADETANPGMDLLIGVRDDLSGFPERPLEVIVYLLDASPATASCGPTVEAIDLPAKPLGEGCAPDTLANPIPVPRTSAGYYSYSLATFDRAGNRSAPVERRLLVDLEPPSIGSLEVSTPLVPGEEMSVSASVDDDVDLLSADFRLVFPGSTAGETVAIPFGAPTSVGMAFDDVLSTSASAVAALPFVRTLTFGSDEMGSRPTVLVDSIRGTARDAAGLTSAVPRYIPPAEYGNDTSTTDPFQRFTTAIATADRTAVCTAGCLAGDPLTVRISARVEGESGTGRPFAHIHFYRRDDDGILSHIGSLAGTEATITDAGNRSTYVYTMDHTPPVSLTGEYGIVAVGVNSRGNALATEIGTAPAVLFYRR